MTGGPKRLDITGRTYGRLTVLGFSRRDRNKALLWWCRCECGVVKEMVGASMKSGHAKSCGCYAKERTSEVMSQLKIKHGMSYSSEYISWGGMLYRCGNPNCKHYAAYGGRGIKVCKRWMKFENFYKDMGPKPGPKYSIDRIDNDGNYCKNNCRWSTNVDQCNNQRRSVFIEFNGKRQTISQWAVEIGIPPTTIANRMKNNRPLEEVLSPHKVKTIRKRN